MSQHDTIPPITDPLGAYWRQPKRESVLIDSKHAVMDKHAFSSLAEYSSSIPSGVYPGKMWRAEHAGRHWLRWFGIVPGRDDVCSNNQREILIVE